MSKSLKAIQVISKILRILTIIGFVGTIVAAVGCGLTAFFFKTFPFSQYELDGVMFDEYIFENTGVTIETVSAVCLSTCIVLIGEAVCLGFEKNYYKAELNDGTPFTFYGANLLKSTAIKGIFISLGAVILASVYFSIESSFNPNVVKVDLQYGFSIGWYLLLLFLSVVFRYGAEKSSIQR